MSLAHARFAVSLFVVALLVSPALAQTFKLSGENTKVEFTGTKKDGSHTGNFKKLSGTATLKEAKPESLSLSVAIDVDSMTTDDAKLTGHLKSPDFFEVKKYPEAKFVSNGVTKASAGYTVSGELTMHGETKKLSFPAEISASADGLKLSSKFKLSRSEWGITYGKGQVNDEVAMKIEITAKK